ncbi:aminotransferase class V-fold PLP-dependent enzyme, partial [Klebsiella pneumoniae]|uniref:aminotransferase class V-fold PLP-dependent enzyme n=1 Tax=Klebsiella pneumoniae TaxID=573 RepID=UPI00301303B6
TIFARNRARLPNTIGLAVDGLTAETAVIAFDLAGVALSSGSACSSGKVTASHVLKAMGVARDLLKGGLRISLGIGTTDAEIARFEEI